MWKRFQPVVIAAVAASGAYYYGSYRTINQQRSIFDERTSTSKLANLSLPVYCSPTELQLAIGRLQKILRDDQVVNSLEEIERHSNNSQASVKALPTQRPKYVVYPESTQEVSEVMKIAHEFKVPVVPYSGGSSLEGNFYVHRGGIVVDTLRMAEILAINESDLDAVVQAGVTWPELNSAVNPKGLMFGPDCSPTGQLSGMVATNASGVNAYRYGSMSANVISVTAVLADGTIVKTKQRPRKSSAGYNLTGLFVGSEGTLGIVTEIVVKLHVKPACQAVIACQFKNIHDLSLAVVDVFKAGIQPDAIEMMDSEMMRINNLSGLLSTTWEEIPTIFFRVGGMNNTVVKEFSKRLRSIMKANNAKTIHQARDKDEEEEIFAARKNALYSIVDYGINKIDPNVNFWITDVAVPLSRLPLVLDQIQQEIKASPFEAVVVGHAGDGNIHADVYYKDGQKEECGELVLKMTMIGLENEGTCTGEHGVGSSKRKYLEKELGVSTVDLMRRLKIALDPYRLLNPDKIFKIDPKDQDP